MPNKWLAQRITTGWGLNTGQFLFSIPCHTLFTMRFCLMMILRKFRRPRPRSSQKCNLVKEPLPDPLSSTLRIVGNIGICPDKLLKREPGFDRFTKQVWCFFWPISDSLEKSFFLKNPTHLNHPSRQPSWQFPPKRSDEMNAKRSEKKRVWLDLDFQPMWWWLPRYTRVTVWTLRHVYTIHYIHSAVARCRRRFRYVHT